MSDDKIEHHWHAPTRAQVVNALQQWATDNKEEVFGNLNKVVAAAIKAEVAGQVSAMLRTDKYDQLILNTIADVVAGEKKVYESNGYGFYNRIRDLVNQKIQQLVLQDYKVTVSKNEGK